MARDSGMKAMVGAEQAVAQQEARTRLWREWRGTGNSFYDAWSSLFNDILVGKRTTSDSDPSEVVAIDRQMVCKPGSVGLLA